MHKKFSVYLLLLILNLRGSHSIACSGEPKEGRDTYTVRFLALKARGGRFGLIIMDK